MNDDRPYAGAPMDELLEQLSATLSKAMGADRGTAADCLVQAYDITEELQLRIGGDPAVRGR